MSDSNQSSSSSSSWKLPDGIEDHIATGVINTTVGTVVGGLFGLVLFRAGGGTRAASAATGFGIGLGATIERARRQLNGPNYLSTTTTTTTTSTTST
mmetsp:Transcript_13365/g.22748  ORF Transcript_13365/g.22748 Transcript_13365/m.22748 type:complete len:97 (-) Transcript_13365:203-493(-)